MFRFYRPIVAFVAMITGSSHAAELRLKIDERNPNIGYVVEHDPSLPIRNVEIARTAQWIHQARLPANCFTVVSHGISGQLYGGVRDPLPANKEAVKTIRAELGAAMKPVNLWLPCDLASESRPSRNWLISLSKDRPGTLHLAFGGEVNPIPVVKGLPHRSQLSLQQWLDNPERLLGIMVSDNISVYRDGDLYDRHFFKSSSKAWMLGFEVDEKVMFPHVLFANPEEEHMNMYASHDTATKKSPVFSFAWDEKSTMGNCSAPVVRATKMSPVHLGPSRMRMGTPVTASAALSFAGAGFAAIGAIAADSWYHGNVASDPTRLLIQHLGVASQALDPYVIGMTVSRTLEAREKARGLMLEFRNMQAGVQQAHIDLGHMKDPKLIELYYGSGPEDHTSPYWHDKMRGVSNGFQAWAQNYRGCNP